MSVEPGAPKGVDTTKRTGMLMTALSRLRPQTLWVAPSGPDWGPLPEMLLTLTFVTGLVDAVSILAPEPW